VKRAILSGAIVFVSGCTTLTSTPQQRLAIEQFAACRAETGAHSAQLDAVTPQGRIAKWHSDRRDNTAMRKCLSERFGRRFQDDDLEVQRRIADGVAGAERSAGAARTRPRDWPSTSVFVGDVVTVVRNETFRTQMTLRATRTESRIEGTWYNQAGASGRFSATVDGGRLRDFVSYQDMPCTGLFTGQAVMKDDGKRIVGRYTGQSCRGPAEAYFVGDRE